MKAQTLKQAVNIFNPEMPLQTTEELKRYFVSRDNSPLFELEIFLETTDTQPKLLFTGHRGSGKSTELAKLAANLRDEFYIVNYSVKQVINLFDINYVDVILSLATELVKSAADNKLKLNKKLSEDLFEWFKQEVVKEVVIDTKAGTDINASLNVLVAKLSAKLGAETSTRTLVRQKLEPRLSELLERIDTIIANISNLTQKKVLIIVEDLDKADLNRAREIFCGHSMSLTQPCCPIIFTFPTALRHDNDFMNIRLNFAEPYVLPIFKTSNRKGQPDQPGKELLSRIILNRLDEKLITEKALELIVQISGGIPRELIMLIRRAALIALQQSAATIDAAIVEQAANRVRNDYRVLLTSRQLEILGQVAQTKTVDNNEEYRALLHNLSILEYRNDDVWYDVHPLVKSLAG